MAKTGRILIAEVMEAKKSGKIPEVYLNRLMDVTCIELLHGQSKILAFICGGHFLRMLLNIMTVGKGQSRKSAGALVAIEDSKRKLNKIEQELHEAEELKSLKPAEIIEALSKRKMRE